MNRETYLKELKKYLKRLPEDDYKNAMEYFTEYFEEAGPDHEAEAIRELGSPREAAAELLSALIDEKTGASSSTGDKGQSHRYRSGDPIPQGRRSNSPLRILLIVCLAIFAAPVALPLAASAFVLLLAGVAIVVSVVFCIFICSVSMVLVGIYSVIRAFALLTVSLPGFLVITGGGLLSVGLGCLLFIASLFLCKWFITWLVRLIQKMIGKRKEN